MKPSTKLKKGDKLKYTGKGFLSYVPEDRDMIYVRKDEKYIRDHWVTYKGKKLVVTTEEICPVK